MAPTFCLFTSESRAVGSAASNQLRARCERLSRLRQAPSRSAPRASSASAGEVRRERGCLLRNQGGPRLESPSPPGRFPAPRAAFRHPRRRRLWAPLRAAAFRKRGPVRVRRRQSRSAMCLSAVSGSATLLPPRQETVAAGLLDLGPSRPPSRRRPSARGMSDGAIHVPSQQTTANCRHGARGVGIGGRMSRSVRRGQTRVRPCGSDPRAQPSRVAMSVAISACAAFEGSVIQHMASGMGSDPQGLTPFRAPRGWLALSRRPAHVAAAQRAAAACLIRAPPAFVRRRARAAPRQRDHGFLPLPRLRAALQEQERTREGFQDPSREGA
jgi:hypothetical protein